MVPNEQLIYSYELLGISPETGLEESHQAYLKQLDIWNPNAIDEEANPPLYQQVRLRRQAIEEAHRCIVEYHEQSEGAGEMAEAAAQEQLQVSPQDERPDEPSSSPQSDTDGVENLSPEATESLEALSNSHDTEAELGSLESVPPEPDTFVQSTGNLSPTEEDPATDDDAPPSMVAPSYGEAAPEREEPPKAAAIFQLIRWDKPAGRVILMIPALWAAFLATGSGMPSWRIIIIIVLGSIATSAAGCAVNDLWDQEFDSQVARTQERPLAAGRMSRRSAQIVLGICCVVSILLALQLNWVSIQLCVAAGIVILLYPGAKRVFPVPQLVLAIAWGFAVLIGWAAVTGALTFTTFLLWLATVLWTLGFDTVYAMADQEDDRRIGLNSSALFFAEKTPDVVGLFFAGTSIFMLFVGINQGLSWQFWLALVLTTLGWLLQHRRLIKSQGRPTTRLYGDIFTQNVWLGLLLLAGMILGRPLL